MPSTDPDLMAVGERSGVNYGRMIQRRLAVSERDKPWEMRPSHDLLSVRTDLAKALDAVEGWMLAGDDVVDVASHPDYVAVTDYGYPTVAEEQMGLLAEVWERLEDIHRRLPYVEAWCVVKDSRRSISPMGPRVWTGHTDREQAEAFAPVIAAHYARRAHHTSDRFPDDPGYWGGWTDRFYVGRSVCSIRDVVGPNLSPEEYVRGLGS
jgi:hypothetical protein